MCRLRASQARNLAILTHPRVDRPAPVAHPVTGTPGPRPAWHPGSLATRAGRTCGTRAADALATRFRPRVPGTGWQRAYGPPGADSGAPVGQPTLGTRGPGHPGQANHGTRGVQASAAAVSRRGGQTAPATPGRGESKHPPRAARPTEVGTDHPRPARNPRRVPLNNTFSDIVWSSGNARVYAQKQRGPGTLPKTPGNGCENVMR